MHNASKIFMKFLNSIKAMFRKRQAKKLKRQAKKYKQTSQYRLNGYKKDIANHSEKGIVAQEKIRMIEDKLQTHKNYHTEFVNADLLQTLSYFIAIIVAVGVILSNHVFTSPAISNIVKEYGKENTWYSLIFPIFLMHSEIFLTMLNLYFTPKTTDEIAKIKRKNITKKSKERQIRWCNLQLYVLRFVMGIMILITPMLLLATIMTVDGFSSIPYSIQSYTFLTLAVITDFIIVFGGVYICKSIAFILFHCKRWRIESKINQYRKSYRTSGRNAYYASTVHNQDCEQYNYNLQEYNQELKEHNQNHNPIPDLEEFQFTPNIANFLNQWMDSQENQRTFPPPQQPQDQFRATNTPPSNNPVDANREEIDEPEIEFNLFDLNIRDAEREVDGD